MNIRKNFACALALLIAAGAVTAQADTVSISTLPPGALLNIQAQTVAKVVQEHTDLQMRIVTYNDAAATMASANVGRTEFAYATNDGAGDAVLGMAEHKGKPMKNLRVVAAMSPIRIGLMVRKDSDIKTVADLKGKRYPTGWQGLKEGIILSNALLSTAGLSLKDVDGVSTLNLIRAANDFKAGRLDSTLFAIGAPKVAEIDAAIGLRFLDLPDDDVARKAMASFRPEYTLEDVQPAPNYPGIVGPTTLMDVFHRFACQQGY